MRKDTRIPVTVITGFLGSGKTTLLRRILATGVLRNVAILVHEVAAAGIDQALLEAGGDEVRLIGNGCICCTVKDGFRDGLLELLQRPEVAALSGVVIETTGLADPTPILGTFMADPVLKFHFRIGAIITVVDCMSAEPHFGRTAEFIRQVACADRIVLSKADLAGNRIAAQIRKSVESINPAALVSATTLDDAELAAQLMGPQPNLDEAERLRRVIDHGTTGRSVFGQRADPASAATVAATPFCIEIDEPLDWSAFAMWLTLMLHAHGDKMLRVKGILNVSGSATPVLINGIHRLMHRPEHLARWPDSNRRSILVFIVLGLDPDRVRLSFATLVRRQPLPRTAAKEPRAGRLPRARANPRRAFR